MAAAQIAELVERWTIVWEVWESSPNSRPLNNYVEMAAFVMLSANG